MLHTMCPVIAWGALFGEIVFHVSPHGGRVQGLLPLANAPSASLDPIRLDQVSRCCFIVHLRDDV